MFMQSSFKIFCNMKSYKLSFSLRSSDDTSIAIEPIFKNLLHLVGLQLWSSLRRCWVSLSLLPSGLGTAAPGTQWVWGGWSLDARLPGNLLLSLRRRQHCSLCPRGALLIGRGTGLEASIWEMRNLSCHLGRHLKLLSCYRAYHCPVVTEACTQLHCLIYPP